MIKQKNKFLVAIIAIITIIFGIVFVSTLKSNYKLIDDQIIPIPQEFSVASYEDGSVYIDWKSNYNVSGYEIWYSINGSEYEILKTCSQAYLCGYTISSLDTFSTYTFKVRSYVENNGKNYSAFTNELSIIAIAGNSASVPYQAPTHTHNWSQATCTNAAACSCGAINGSALGHDFGNNNATCSRCGTSNPNYVAPHTHNWSQATCTNAATCSCGATNGYALGHDFGNNNATCSRCGASNPNYVAPHTHNWSQATCTNVATCSCGVTNGSALGHDFGNNNVTCSRCGIANPNYVAPAPKVDEPTLNLSVYLTSDTTISLNWNIENCSNFTKYKLYLSINDGAWNQVRTITDISSTETTSTNLDYSTIYRYKIVAFNDNTEIVSSNIATIITPARKPVVTQSNTTTPTTNTPVVNTPVMADSATIQQYVNDVMKDTNELRRSLGLPELTLDTTLCQMAQYRVEDMGNEGYFSHYKNGETQLKVVRKMYNYKCSNIGENICFTTYNDDLGNRCFESWVGSESHYENLTKPYWTKTGIALYQASNGSWYATQIFAY